MLVTILILCILSATWFIGCPTGALSTGMGWSTDVVIHKGIIHTASYDYDDMSVKYAYKGVTEDSWHIETVEKFFEGEKAYYIGGVKYGGFLKMAVDDEAVWIAYAGLEKKSDDGVLDGVRETSLKLAKRTFDGKWYVKEVTKESIIPTDLEISGHRAYILSSSKTLYKKDKNSLYVVEDDVKEFPLQISGYITWREAIEKLDKQTPYIIHKKIIPASDYLYILSITGVYVSDKYDWYRLEIRGLKLEDSRLNLFFSYPTCISSFCFYESSQNLSMFINHRGEVETLLQYWMGNEYKIIHITGKGISWNVNEIFPPDSLMHLSLRDLQISDYPTLLFARFDWNKDEEECENKCKLTIAVAKLKEGKLVNEESVSVEVYKVLAPYSSVAFHYSSPYIVISFLSIDEDVVNMKGKGKSRRYVNYRGSHRVYIFDGKSWRKEVVR